MGIVFFIQTISGDFQFSSLVIFVGCILLAKSFKESNNETEATNNNNTNSKSMNPVPNTTLEVNEKNTIMVINEIYTLLGEGTVALGQVLQECIEPGTVVDIKTQRGNIIKGTSILNFRMNISEGNIRKDVRLERAYKGDYITVGLRGVDRDAISVGDIICYTNTVNNNNTNPITNTILEVDDNNPVMVIKEVRGFGNNQIPAVIGEILSASVKPNTKIWIKTQSGANMEALIYNLQKTELKSPGEDPVMGEAHKGDNIMMVLKEINRDQISVGDTIYFTK